MHNIITLHKKAKSKPLWLKRKILSNTTCRKVKNLLQDFHINTVCYEARCPNMGECFSSGTAAFLVLGNLCTRRCGFCAIEHGSPQKTDPEEPLKIAEMVQHLGLNYAVITSVTRDDLNDGGAGHFARTIHEIRKRMPRAIIEILVPDFQGSTEALKTLIDSHPDVINHNIETVPRLYPGVRPGFDYFRSLSLLRMVRQNAPEIITKSGLMLGLGETSGEVSEVMRDLLDAECSLLTLGQYLKPSDRHLPVRQFVTPEKFNWWKDEALKMGFQGVASGPLVRSSYHAGELYKSKPLN